MLGLSQIKNLIYLIVFFWGLSASSFTLDNTEVSAHLGIKFGSRLNLREITRSNQNEPLGRNQANRSFHLGLDVIYKNIIKDIIVDNTGLALGLRYRLAFTGERNFDGTGSTDGNIGNNQNDKYKFTRNRIALLANYRFHVDQFFIGPVLGIDIWKSLKFSATNLGGSGGNSYEFISRQFLWSQITGQLGVEGGYKINENLFAKLEIGYDLSRFSNLKCKMTESNNALTGCIESNNPLEMEGAKSAHTFRFDALYVTLGVGWRFG